MHAEGTDQIWRVSGVMGEAIVVCLMRVSGVMG